MGYCQDSRSGIITGCFIIGLLIVVSLLMAEVKQCSANANAGSESSQKAALMGHDMATDIPIARVNDVPISMAQLMKKMMDIAEKKYGRREISPLVAQKIKDDATQELITEELVYQKSVAAGAVVSEDDVLKRVDTIIQQKGGEEAFVQYLKAESLDRATFQENLRRAMVLQKYLETGLYTSVEVTDEEIRQAYLGAKDKYFEKHEEVQVTDVVFFLDPSEEESLTQVGKVREKAMKETDKKLSALVSDGSFVVRDNVKLNKETQSTMYNLAKELGPYGISGPVNVDGTLHMIQLTGYQPEVTKTFEEVHDYLVGELTKRKQEQLLTQWLQTIRQGASIEIIDLEE